jgi:hypothetical protein
MMRHLHQIPTLLTCAVMPAQRISCHLSSDMRFECAEGLARHREMGMPAASEGRDHVK